MYYSSIGILACLILIITNFNILIGSASKKLQGSHKAYRIFLFSVLTYYITDIFWAPCYYLKLTKIAFVETTIYFIAMAIAVMMWTKYVIEYLNQKNKFALFLKYTGRLFLYFQIIILIINIFIPVVFWFDEDGSYNSEPARNIILIIQIVMFMIVNVYMFLMAVKSQGKIRRKHRAIGIFSSTMIVLITLQLFFPLLPFYAIGYMLGTCILHTFVLEDEKEAHRSELESILQVEQIQEMELGQTRALAYQDPLTGVKNKMAYIEDIGGFDTRIENNDLSDFAMIVFDVNDLKKVNDTRGHDAGDKHIKRASSFICERFKHSPVYRIGGDEFVVFLMNEDFQNREKLVKSFDSAIEKNVREGKIVISSGYAEYIPGLDKTYLRLFERADKYMYDRKQKLKEMQHQYPHLI